METIYNYDSASVALKSLEGKGYLVDYNHQFDHLLEHSSDFVIDYLYRYEGATDPSDESSVYGLRNVKTNEKGVFVAGDLSLIEGKKRDIIINLEVRSKKL